MVMVIVIALMMVVIFNLLKYLSVLADECDRPNGIKTTPCEGHVIETHSVWTLIQCFDLCLRSNLCDSYTFNRQEFGEHNCTLLNTDMAQISGGDNLYVKSGLCGTFRSRDDKVQSNLYLLFARQFGYLVTQLMAQGKSTQVGLSIVSLSSTTVAKLH